MPPQPRIALASGFPAMRIFLQEALPEGRLETVELPRLQPGLAADVLVPAMGRADGPLMDAISGLRLVQQWGAGLEVVDIPAATARGIAVANVPTVGTGNAESVAEWCVLAALALSRRLREADRTIREGTAWGAPIGQALLGRTAGIVGLGGIGRALAARLRPFGMRLLAVKRHPDPALAAALGLEWLGSMDALPELLRRSDYLFLCVPLGPETRGLLDAAEFALLPPGAMVVNPARGGLLSEDALLTALSAGRLAGAGLDVFGAEPLDPGSPLLSRDEILATPHIAGVTDVSYRGIARVVAENVRRLFAGRALLNCANADALTAR